MSYQKMKITQKTQCAKVVKVKKVSVAKGNSNN
jgi:hypothetical protein